MRLLNLQEITLDYPCYWSEEAGRDLRTHAIVQIGKLRPRKDQAVPKVTSELLWS